jgi:hypothetical protein
MEEGEMRRVHTVFLHLQRTPPAYRYKYRNFKQYFATVLGDRGCGGAASPIPGDSMTCIYEPMLGAMRSCIQKRCHNAFRLSYSW